jgi:hypothetical protein
MTTVAVSSCTHSVASQERNQRRTAINQQEEALRSGAKLLVELPVTM